MEIKTDVISIRVKEFLFFLEWNLDPDCHPSEKQDPTRVYHNGVVISNFWNFCGVEISEVDKSVLYKMLIPIYLEDEAIAICKEVEKKLWEEIAFGDETE